MNDRMKKFVSIGIAPRGVIAIGLVPMGFVAIGGVSMGIINGDYHSRCCWNGFD